MYQNSNKNIVIILIIKILYITLQRQTGCRKNDNDYL